MTSSSSSNRQLIAIIRWNKILKSENVMQQVATYALSQNSFYVKHSAILGAEISSYSIWIAFMADDRKFSVELSCHGYM